MTEEWHTALKLVRTAFALPCGAHRESALSKARLFLERASDARMRFWAPHLKPGAGDREILCALVPLERADTRSRLSDADLGITTQDATPAPPGGAGASSRGIFPVSVALDNIRAALNTGSIFRTAEFFGLESVAVCGYTAGPENPQVARSALGAEKAIPCARFASVRDAVAAAKAEGRFVIALETRLGAAPPETVNLAFPALLLLGSERFGLDPSVVESADAVCAIPGHGMKNSLNVAVAFAVVAAALRRRFDESTPRAPS